MEEFVDYLVLLAGALMITFLIADSFSDDE